MVEILHFIYFGIGEWKWKDIKENCQRPWRSKRYCCSYLEATFWLNFLCCLAPVPSANDLKLFLSLSHACCINNNVLWRFSTSPTTINFEPERVRFVEWGDKNSFFSLFILLRSFSDATAPARVPMDPWPSCHKCIQFPVIKSLIQKWKLELTENSILFFLFTSRFYMCRH